MGSRIGGAGLGLGLLGFGSNAMALGAGEVYTVPSGQFYVQPGLYTLLQYKDPVTGLWRGHSPFNSKSAFVDSDGASVRVANLTGCVVGASLTNNGAGYASAPTVTASSGSSAFTAIVGGALTLAVANAGANYTYAPIVLIPAPPTGGVPATAVAAITGGVVTGIVMIDQGAGYNTAPAITLAADPRETTGSGATATATLAGAGTVTAVLCTNHGLTVAGIPTLTFSGGGSPTTAATALAVMCLTTTGPGTVTAGAGYGNAQAFEVLSAGGLVGGGAAIVNPSISTNLIKPRQARVSGVSTAGGAISATGAVIEDGGMFSAAPGSVIIGSAIATTQGAYPLAVGGVTDTVLIQPY